MANGEWFIIPTVLTIDVLIFLKSYFLISSIFADIFREIISKIVCTRLFVPTFVSLSGLSKNSWISLICFCFYAKCIDFVESSLKIDLAPRFINVRKELFPIVLPLFHYFSQRNFGNFVSFLSFCRIHKRIVRRIVRLWRAFLRQINYSGTQY